MFDSELAEFLRLIASENHPGSDPALEQFILARNINRFYHFTSVDNIESIFEHGFLGVQELIKLGVNYSLSDYSREDPIENGVCFSISYPNEYMMLHKIRNGRKLVLLELTQTLQILKNNLFIASPGNFGSFKVKNHFQQWPELFSGGQGLSNLFNNHKIRQKYNLSPNEPTDPRSEIIILEPLNSKFISKVIFPPDLEYASQENVRKLIHKLPLGIEIVSRSQELFEPLNWKDSKVSAEFFERTWSPDWN